MPERSQNLKTVKISILIILILGFVLASYLLFKPKGDQLLPNPKLAEITNFADLQNYAKSFGAENAYRLLKQKYTNNETVAHDFAHVIGIVAFDQTDISGLSICDTAYNYGCFHGFIEKFLIKKGVEAINQIEASCLSLGQIHSPSCLHGVGHGVLANRSYDLNLALSDCDRLKLETRIYCFDGVFMERIAGSMQDAKDRQLFPQNDLKKPCVSLSYVYKSQCWRNQVTAWFAHFGQNPWEVANMCFSSEKEFHSICFESLGLVNVIITGDNFQKLVDSCRLLSNQISDDCLLGEIKELLFEGKSPQIAQSLCQFVLTSRKNDCQNVFQDHYRQYQQRFGRSG